MALACIDVVGQQDVAHAIAHTFRVLSLGGHWFERQRAQYLAEQLAGPFIKAPAHHARLGRLRVHVEYILRVDQVLARYRANAPPFFQPRLALPFFNPFRTICSEIEST